jgi:hypothetical protein
MKKENLRKTIFYKKLDKSRSKVQRPVVAAERADEIPLAANSLARGRPSGQCALLSPRSANGSARGMPKIHPFFDLQILLGVFDLERLLFPTKSVFHPFCFLPETVYFRKHINLVE